MPGVCSKKMLSILQYIVASRPRIDYIGELCNRLVDFGGFFNLGTVWQHCRLNERVPYSRRFSSAAAHDDVRVSHRWAPKWRTYRKHTKVRSLI